jgi:hypothetical protein
MGIFSWLNNTSQLTQLMARAGSIVLQLTGNNPEAFSSHALSSLTRKCES